MVSVYEYYDGDMDAVDSHFKLDSLDLDTANVTGLFQVGELGGGFGGGFMTPVPQEWQQDLGARILTGQAKLAVIGRTSAGPAAFGFDPADLGSDHGSRDPVSVLPAEPSAGPAKRAAQDYNTTATSPIFSLCRAHVRCCTSATMAWATCATGLAKSAATRCDPTRGSIRSGESTCTRSGPTMRSTSWRSRTGEKNLGDPALRGVESRVAL